MVNRRGWVTVLLHDRTRAARTGETDGAVGVTGEHQRGRLMSTTDDIRSTTTPDATTLDPAMLDEVEQALTAAQDGGDTTDGGIPHAETTRPGGGVAHPNGGIPHAEVVRP